MSGTFGSIFLVGCVVTLRFDLPRYRQVISWQTPESAHEWTAVRGRLFRLNLIRFGSAVVPFTLLVYAVLYP